jgi:hypothetical protein
LIVANNKSGLGNRIKSIISAMRLSEEYGVHWTKNKDLTCDFSDLFSNKVEVSTISRHTPTYPSWRMAILDSDDIPDNFSIVTANRDRAGNKFSYTCSRGRNVDLEYERIPLSVKEDIVKTFNKLQINKDILNIVEKFSKEHFGDFLVSVHIRSWADDEDRNRDFHRLQSFINRMSAFEQNVRFFVTSDSDYVKSEILKAFGDRVIIYPRSTDIKTSRQNSHGIIEDFIEMLLLSKGDYILGTYLSTYTEVAWWFGGALAKVEVF